MMTKRAGRGNMRTAIVLNGVNEGLRAYRHKSLRWTEKGDNRRQRDTFDRSFFFFHPPVEMVIRYVNWETGISPLFSEYSLAMFASSPQNTTLFELTLASDILIAWRVNQASYVYNIIAIILCAHSVSPLRYI